MKDMFIRSFVNSFMAKAANYGVPAAAVVSSLEKLAATTSELEAAEGQLKALRAQRGLGREQMITNVASPFALGSAAGGLLAKAFSPSDEEVSNMERMDLLNHYDKAIAEVERRIATRG